ncbi:quinone-dependent dihydroorotate dehydrogenase [Nakamurella flava]|uniref:Dihydroorotate dehydrogenase (quinone) n=1 Tax=Nakamurella flava TaxID=2576308 RepID=A0A4U6QMY5_9ACTN|nr:quinone-dependent dihydroorotate dehydrogenase [Nakamurella flava]TKV61538.1 quinone-dependent dihydroorotate dehydrogenase [Nakamurella flava]
MNGLYGHLARPVLFRMGGGDPEVAHHRTLGLLGRVGRSRPSLAALHKLYGLDAAPRTVFGVDFPGVVGLAAGMDKDGLALKAWPALGFGFVEVGTVTAHGQPGNPQPRMFRLKESEAIINRMGFNNSGAAVLARTLERTGPIGVPIGVSLGKSKITPVDQAVGDYLTSLRAVHPFADYIAVNVSSPNTPGLRSLQDRGPLDELLGALTEEAACLAAAGPAGRTRRPVPVLVKIAPDLTDQAIAEVLQVCADRGIAGVIATNTTLGRDGLTPADAEVGGAQAGGLSGRPLTERAREVVRFVASRSDLPVIGVGGIMSVDDGLALLDSGAALLQIYSGLIYAGPDLVTGLNRRIAAGSPVGVAS